MSSLHECPCGCGKRIARNKLACRTGWFALPSLMRDNLTAALRRRDFRAHRAHLVEALDWYRERRGVGA